MRLKFLQTILHIAAGILVIGSQEYLSSAVNVLANSFKIFVQSKAVFFQLNLPDIHAKKG